MFKRSMKHFDDAPLTNASRQVKRAAFRYALKRGLESRKAKLREQASKALKARQRRREEEGLYTGIPVGVVMLYGRAGRMQRQWDDLGEHLVRFK